MVYDHEEIIDCMVRHKGDNQPFVVATVVRTEDSTAGNPGDKAIIRADGTVVGWVGGGCTLGAVKKAAAAALQDGQPRMIRVRPKDMLADEAPVDGVELHASSCPSRGTTEVFIDPVLPHPRLLVVGTSPVAGALCGLAKAMGYVVAVAGTADDLGGFDDVDHRIDGLGPLPEDTPAFRYVVVSSQGKRDRDALICGLSTGADYVAFVGSRRKAEKLKADLVDAGLDADRVGAVRSPAGLHIGAVTPDEIALSILADIVRERRLGEGGDNRVAAEPGKSGRGQLPERAGAWQEAPGRQSMTAEAAPYGISAVLLAAGLSERMAGANKLLLEVEGAPMVRRTAEAILGCGVSELVVVLGHDRERIAEAVRGLPCTCVFNARYADGQMTSVRAGLAAVSPDSDAVMVCLADQPLLSPEDYRSLILASASIARGRIAVPTVKGERGNPIILPVALKDEVLERGVAFGCRNLIRDNPALVAPVEMHNPNFIRDIDTREAYRAIIA